MDQDLVDALRAAGCVFAEDEARLLTETAASPTHLAALVAQRVKGLPLEHVLGWAEFYGRRVLLDPGVFIPRRRTEALVAEAVRLGHRSQPPLLVVDLCCGSGAVGAALASALPQVTLHAADLDPVAVACARRNVEPLGGRVHEGDLFEPLPGGLRGRVDLLAANVPYVPTGEVALMPREARDHEARLALDGGTDGLDVLRRVSSAASEWLAPGGSLLVETSERQAPEAVATFAGDGLAARVVVEEDLGATVVVGTRPH